MQVISLDPGFMLTLHRNKLHLDTQLEDTIEHFWLVEQERRKGMLFNGKIMSVSHVSPHEIRGHIMDYRHLIAQRACPYLFDILHLRPVAVSGLLECADGIVLGRRSNKVLQDKGAWELAPSGGIDTSQISPQAQFPVQIDFVEQILLELNQEIGIAADRVTEIKPFCLLDDPDTHVVDIGIYMQSALCAEEIYTAYHMHGSKEYDELRIIPAAGALQIIEAEQLCLATTSASLLQAHFVTTNLQECNGN